MKQYYFISGAFLLTILVLTSCKDKSFIKTKNATKEFQSIDGSSFVKIKSYNMTFNPKATGLIVLELENGAEYQAGSLDGGSFSSINSLLKEPNVLFDTVRKELIFGKFIQN